MLPELPPKGCGNDLELQSVVTEDVTTPLPVGLDGRIDGDFESETGLLEDGYMDNSAEILPFRCEEA